MITIQDLVKARDLINFSEKICFLFDENIFSKLDKENSKKVSNTYRSKTLFGYKVYLNESNNLYKGLNLVKEILKIFSYDRVYYVNKEYIYSISKDILLIQK